MRSSFRPMIRHNKSGFNPTQALQLGAMILSGGASSRMGADKGGMDWSGRRAVDRVADVARGLGVRALITVGAQDYGLDWIADQPPLGGPAGGVLAGAAALRAAGCDRILVLAVDAPTLRAQDLAPLLDAEAPAAAYEGLHLPFVMRLDALAAEAAAGWPLGRLLERAGTVRLDCPPQAAARLRGANTPEERDALLAELFAQQGAQDSGAR